jgi:hypothetical protein
MEVPVEDEDRERVIQLHEGAALDHESLLADPKASDRPLALPLEGAVEKADFQASNFHHRAWGNAQIGSRCQ